MTDQRERVESFAEELREDSPPSERSIGEVANALRPQVQELVNKQVELARTELVPVARQAGIAAGLLAVAGFFMALFTGFFFATMILALNAVGFPAWVSAGITTVILLVIGGTLGALGAARLRTMDPKPHRTIAALQQNIEWVKGQLRP